MHKVDLSPPRQHTLTTLFIAWLLIIASCNSPKRESDGGKSPQSETSSNRSEQSSRIAQPMSSDEARIFLRETRIRELNLENTSVTDAIEVINQTLRQQLPDAKRPKIRLSSNWPNNALPPAKLKELRLHDVPVGIALKYICDQTRSVFWVHRGEVIVDAFREMEDEAYERFLNTRIGRFEIKDSNLLDAVDALQATADKAEFDARKPGFTYPSIVYRRAEITRDAVANRVREVSMQNATVGDALREICRQAGASYQFFEGEFLILPDNVEETSPIDH